ncbi:MAG: serine hydrolase domain-containing protein [Sphingomonadaceae bacterium]
MRRPASTLLLALLMAAAIVPSATAAVAAPIPRERLSGLGDFVDGVMAQQLASREVAGAVVTIVHDDRVILSRGYGKADVARGQAVDPETSLFRPGSVSKLFTWILLMQLVEQGRVGLDDDVNRYLDFTIPPFAGQPVRVRDLLTHSPGFNETSGIITRDAAQLKPFREWMRANLPRRLWPAGTEIAYSNYGSALAGIIVEQVTGQPFEQAAEQRLFAPLGMRATTFAEPLPSALAPHLATGYRLEQGRFVAQLPERISAIMPAGSATTSAPDMARFMRMLLNEGRLDGRRVLAPASVRFLMADGMANAPDLPGMGHGFIVYRKAGPRLVGHGGNTADFRSLLLLAPEARLGVFISMTGGSASRAARTELADLLVGRLFPQLPSPRLAAPDGEVVPIGTYRPNRRDHDRPSPPAALLTVAAAGSNAITVMQEGQPSHWERVGPLLYERTTGAGPTGPFDRLQFRQTPDGWVLVIGSLSHMLYRRIDP